VYSLRAFWGIVSDSHYVMEVSGPRRSRRFADFLRGRRTMGVTGALIIDRRSQVLENEPGWRRSWCLGAVSG
jgi:hypothetical protein